MRLPASPVGRRLLLLALVVVLGLAILSVVLPFVGGDHGVATVP